MEFISKKELKKRITKLNQCVQIQCTDGTWDWDSYMFGMANGMIFSQSVIKNEDPEFMTAPKMWGVDRAKCLKKLGEGEIRFE